MQAVSQPVRPERPGAAETRLDMIKVAHYACALYAKLANRQEREEWYAQKEEG
jgi:hypothetical protein